jgi:hypothetical protein
MTIARGQPMLASDILDLTFFPVGSILMMDGSWTDGRGGWYICDGRDTPHGNTPNLKDKFIRGGTTSGVEGGSDTGSTNVDLTADNLPAHNHPLSGNLTTSTESQGLTHTVTAGGTVANGGTHSHSIYDPGHQHRIEGGGSHSNQGYLYESGASINGVEWAISNSATTGITVTATGSSHDHAFTGKQVTSGDVNKNHTHTLALSGSTGNSTGSSSVSVPVSVSTVPVYYTMIYIKKMV